MIIHIIVHIWLQLVSFHLGEFSHITKPFLNSSKNLPNQLQGILIRFNTLQFPHNFQLYSLQPSLIIEQQLQIFFVTTDLSTCTYMIICTSYHGTHWHMNYYIEYAAFIQYYNIMTHMTSICALLMYILHMINQYSYRIMVCIGERVFCSLEASWTTSILIMI